MPSRYRESSRRSIVSREPRASTLRRVVKWRKLSEGISTRRRKDKTPPPRETLRQRRSAELRNKRNYSFNYATRTPARWRTRNARNFREVNRPLLRARRFGKTCFPNWKTRTLAVYRGVYRESDVKLDFNCRDISLTAKIREELC